MLRFEDEFPVILQKFKDGRLNIAEAVLEAEQLIIQSIGFSLYASDLIAKAYVDALRKIENT